MSPDNFIEHNTVLYKWQHDLEWILFTLCHIRIPHIIISRGWTSYRAAELTLLTEDVTRFCMDQKQLVAAAGVAGDEREDFVRDLQTARAIRHAAVHRSPVSKATMNRFSVCFQRLSSTAKQIIGPSVDNEYQDMIRWMGRHGWLLDEINCASLRQLRDNSDLGKRMLLEDQALSKSRKEKRERDALKAWQAAETRRAERIQKVRVDQQAANTRRLERKQRDCEQRARENYNKAQKLDRLAKLGDVPQISLQIFGFFDMGMIRFTPLG